MFLGKLLAMLPSDRWESLDLVRTVMVVRRSWAPPDPECAPARRSLGGWCNCDSSDDAICSLGQFRSRRDANPMAMQHVALVYGDSRGRALEEVQRLFRKKVGAGT